MIIYATDNNKQKSMEEEINNILAGIQGPDCVNCPHPHSDHYIDEDLHISGCLHRDIFTQKQCTCPGWKSPYEE